MIADSHKTCEVLNAIQFDTKEDVDAFYEKVIAAG
jgi:predicted lactoylglutathione lyase